MVAPYLLRRLAAIFSVPAALAMPAPASAQEPFQINVPMKCEDGITRTVTRCATNARGGEVCAWREEKNGQLIVERFNVRGQMDGWLKMCQSTAPPAAPAAPPQAAAPPPSAPAPAATPASTNPSYLGGFPPRDRVMLYIHGSAPLDSLERQVATLNQLAKMVKRMQSAPGRAPNSTTPDEQRLMDTYAKWSDELAQRFLKTAPPDGAQAFQQAVGRYEVDQALTEQVYALLTPPTLAEFQKINGGANAQVQTRIDQIRQNNTSGIVGPQPQQPPPQASAASPGNGSPFVRNDPGTLAVRRCLELGGGDLECIGRGFTTGLFDLSGVNVKAIEPPKTAGIRLGGTYKTAAGLALSFSTDTVAIGACGKLVEDGRGYTVTRRGAQLDVSIENMSKPLLVSLGADGRLTGPAAFDVDGRIITGYRTYWVEERRVSDNSVVPGSGHQVQEPIYGPKTERCAFPSLRATAPVVAEGSLIGSIVGIATGGPADPAAQKSGAAEAPAGARMTGTYAGGGLQLEFHPTAVVMDCGEAHVLQPYTVENLADRLVVTVKNGATPVPLAVQPDGTLAGTSAVDVTGRVVTGATDTAVTYAQRSARCSAASLAPKR